MELVVFNTSGKETGRTVQLDEAIFGIEPNQHAVYLEVKQQLLLKSLKSKKDLDLQDTGTSNLLHSEVEVEFSVQNQETTDSN